MTTLSAIFEATSRRAHLRPSQIMLLAHRLVNKRLLRQRFGMQLVQHILNVQRGIGRGKMNQLPVTGQLPGKQRFLGGGPFVEGYYIRLFFRHIFFSGLAACMTETWPRPKQECRTQYDRDTSCFLIECRGYR
jgi:hypothetical protein